MPKANAKDVYYFSHDCNARNDEKILAMRSVYGLEGYAMYFMIIEIMREQSEYKLEITKYIWSALAMQMHTDASKVQNFVNDCINEFHLLVQKEGYLYSESLLKRMSLFKEVSEARSKAAKSRWENANTMQKQCKSNANAMQSDANKTKLNYTKENEIKLNQNNSMPDGVLIHENSGVMYRIGDDGEKYALNGDKLNSAGYPILPSLSVTGG